MVEAKSVCKAASVQFVFHNTRGLVNTKWKLSSLGTVPHVSTICLADVIARDQISQAFPPPYLPSPLCICILQILKGVDKGGGGLGGCIFEGRLSKYFHILYTLNNVPAPPLVQTYLRP